MTRIVVLGGGFGGLQATIEIERRLGREAEILLVSEQNFLLFTPLLPQVAASGINPRHIVQTVRDVRGRRRFRFRRDTVIGVDLAAHTVQLASGPLPYDALVMALGSRSNYFGIPGARERTWDFKTLEDAVTLRDRVIDLCEHADHTPDPAARRAMLTFTIVGGGYTGVELASELRDFLFGYVARRYRGIDASEIRLLVLEATSEVLRGIGPKLAAHARRRLAVSGIEVRTSARVTRCTEASIEVNGAESIPTATIVWTAGVRAHPLVEALPGPHDRAGRAMVSSFLELDGHPEVFVVGDGAASATAPDAPQVAPVAIAQGNVAGRNVAAFLHGKPLEAYSYKAQGMLVSLGMNYAVLNVGGVQISGYFAWLFWNAVHLYKLVGLKKQLQVCGDWLLGLIFARDTSIVRRPQRCPICDAIPR
jgi:NADH:ubiquinone reductase (H+-translocating)